MKLCCFVILLFISVIFTVGGEWGTEGIGRVNSLPMPSTNQNEVKSKSYSEQLLTKRSYTDKQLKRKIQNFQGEEGQEKHPNPNNSTNQTKQSSNNKGKDGEGQNAQSQNSESANAKKLEEEAQTISRVIVVLGSLGASLLLVAIAIAVLYWKVRRQQKLVKSVKDIKIVEGITNDDNNNNNNNSGNGSGNGNGKGDDGGGVGDGETNIITSDDSESLYTAHLMSEKSNIINPNSSGGSNNGFGTGVVGDKVNNETSESPFIHHNIQQQLSPPPTAPPAEKVIGDNDLDIDIGSNSNLSTPPLAAPPAYTPTAPPIYALPHIPIDDSVRDLILYTDGNTYQRPNPHNLETNNNNETFIGTSSVAWYAAGPTSQTSTPTNDAPYQQSNPTIIQPIPSSATNLNSSFNSHENNDGNDRPTHQRQTI